MPLLDNNGEEREGKQNRQKTSSWDSNSGNLMRSCAIFLERWPQGYCSNTSSIIVAAIHASAEPMMGRSPEQISAQQSKLYYVTKVWLQVRLQGLRVPFGTEPISSLGAPCQYFFVCLFVLTTNIHCSWCCLEKSVSLDANICSDTSHILCLPQSRLCAFTLHVWAAPRCGTKSRTLPSSLFLQSVTCNSAENTLKMQHAIQKWS